MTRESRPQIPQEKLFVVKRNSKKIDFDRPFTLIYFQWWFQLLDFPAILLAWILAALSAIYFGLRVSGREHRKILRRQGCILVSNHCHYFDTVLASWLLLPRRLYISVAQRNFEVPIVRRILRLVRGFPIPARPDGFEMITGPVGEALRRGHHVLFLPEGELVYLSQQIYRFKSGGFRLAYLHQAPIVPMVCVLTPRRLFGRTFVHWPRIRMVYGEPVLPPAPRPDGALPLDEIHAMMERVAAWMEQTIQTYHRRAATEQRLDQTC